MRLKRARRVGGVLITVTFSGCNAEAHHINLSSTLRIASSTTVTSSIDLDSDNIARLAAANASIVGCTLTFGDLGKVHRDAHDLRITSPFTA